MVAPAISWFQANLLQNDSARESEKLQQEITTLASSLKQAPRDATIPKLHRVKAILKKNKDVPKVEELRKEYLALKLHIHSDVFNNNEGFYDFVKKFPLYNYLNVFKHLPLTVCNDGTVMIRKDGKEVEWSSAIAPNTERLRQGFLYGEKGLQAEDLYGWETLKPFRTDGPKGRFAIEFCTTAADEERFNGDHSWVRLYDEAGNVYSVGLYRPFKRSFKDKWWFPLKTKIAELMSPDVSEFWGVDIQSIKAKISKEQFDQIKKKIEGDQKKTLHYHVLGNNCTRWMMEIAEVAGFQFDCTLHAGNVITPKKVVELKDRYFHLLPRTVQKVCRVFNTIFFNIIQCMLGSTFVDRQVAQAPAYISHLIHLFDEERLKLYSPYRLGKVINKQIEEWRSRERDRRKGTGENLEDVDYLLPPEMLVSASSPQVC